MANTICSSNPQRQLRILDSQKNCSGSQKKFILGIRNLDGFYVCGISENGFNLTESRENARIFSQNDVATINDKLGSKFALKIMEVRR
ncbi:hypothetical protein [Undibacterium sp. Di24W]|uniref:hypothetical protein n=1 Tax=Undibacterium sp. Di24W TaxID=3413033 RepID=UPI003BEFF910